MDNIINKNDMTEELKPTPMFADRENIKEAFDYARDVMEHSVSPEMAIYGTTALMVIWNALANKYKLTKK
tara:strand:- start:333 stop:542 length:210 start_codon:yes stop_codon:yes gene_type:complete